MLPLESFIQLVTLGCMKQIFLPELHRSSSGKQQATIMDSFLPPCPF